MSCRLTKGLSSTSNSTSRHQIKQLRSKESLVKQPSRQGEGAKAVHTVAKDQDSVKTKKKASKVGKLLQVRSSESASGSGAGGGVGSSSTEEDSSVDKKPASPFGRKIRCNLSESPTWSAVKEHRKRQDLFSYQGTLHFTNCKCYKMPRLEKN